MDTMTSSEFRKRYASLERPTEVTVLGRVIGRWTPGDGIVRRKDYTRLVADEDVVDFALGTPDQQSAAAKRLDAGKAGTTIIEPSFNTRPFTPVPKK